VIPCRHKKEAGGPECGAPSVQFWFIYRPDEILELARRAGKPVQRYWFMAKCKAHAKKQEVAQDNMTEEEFIVHEVMLT